MLFWRLDSIDIVSWIPYHRLRVTESVEFIGMCRFRYGDLGLLSLFYLCNFTTSSSQMFQSSLYHLCKCKILTYSVSFQNIQFDFLIVILFLSTFSYVYDIIYDINSLVQRALDWISKDSVFDPWLRQMFWS